MYPEALEGYEKALGSEHTLTLDTFYNPRHPLRESRQNSGSRGPCTDERSPENPSKTANLATHCQKICGLYK